MKKLVFKLLFIVFILLLILAIIQIFDSKEGYDDPINNSISPTASPISSSLTHVEYSAQNTPIVASSTNISLLPNKSATPIAPANSKYNPTNLDIQYHETAEDIQAQLDIDLSANLISVRDASGNIVKKPLSQTTSDTTFYTAGTLKYNPANYVPNYEDTVYFSKLTGLGYHTPIKDSNAQLSGFCKHDRFFPEKIEEKCKKLDSDTCATTTCCVLMGSNKCVAGNFKGPYFKAHYSDIDLRNKDKYYYMGRCYGNCIDDQSNYYDYQITKKSYTQQFPGFAEDNPAYLPNLSDYLAVIAPNNMIGSQSAPNISNINCRIDRFDNLIDNNGSIIAHNASMDLNGNFLDSKGNKIICPVSTTPVSSTPISATPFSLTPFSASPVSATPFSTP